MAQQSGGPKDTGARHPAGGSGRVGDEEIRQGGHRAQPAAGEKDARGLTRDSTLPKGQKAPVPGDAARGPWAVDTTPKGD